MSRK
jgi:SAC3 family protein LENG8/THP3